MGAMVAPGAQPTISCGISRRQHATRPAPHRADLVGVAIVPGSDGRGRLQRACPDLVEAGAAIHRPIVPRRERHHGLTSTRAADRRVELAWSFVVARPLRCGAARRTALRVVDQALAGIEGLLASGEDELLAAVATGQCSILVHDLRTLPTLGRRDDRPGVLPHGTGPSALGADGGTARPVRSGRSPGHSGEDTRAVKRCG